MHYGVGRDRTIETGNQELTREFLLASKLPAQPRPESLCGLSC
jgi:hypothetical protein